MEDNNPIYVDDATQISENVFDTDFDDVAWDPIVEDDSDEDAAELYGY